MKSKRPTKLNGRYHTDNEDLASSETNGREFDLMKGEEKPTTQKAQISSYLFEVLCSWKLTANHASGVAFAD